jgi:hypothetical protein
MESFQQVGWQRQNSFCITAFGCLYDLSCRPFGIHGKSRQAGPERKPGEFTSGLATELGIEMGASTHQAWDDRCHPDPCTSQFGA